MDALLLDEQSRLMETIADVVTPLLHPQ